MANARSAARAMVRALRPVIESHHERHGRQSGRATITYLHGSPASRTFTAELHGTGLVLSDQNTTFAQMVVEYDLHSGLVVGDTLIVVELDEDDWTAVAVESDTDSTGAATPEEVAAAIAAVEAKGHWEPGDVKLTARAAAPEGWLLCEGQAVSRATFAALFAAVGTTYGAGDGSTTFNLPDGRGRAFIGSGTPAGAAGGTNHALGSKGGEETHALAEGELPAHKHGVTDPGHAHGVTDPGHHHVPANESGSGLTISYVEGGSGGQTGSLSHGGYNNGFIITTTNVTGVTINAAATGISTNNAGGGASHNNLQPFVTGNWLIKT